jgi:hypothetical protein
LRLGGGECRIGKKCSQDQHGSRTGTVL